MRRPAGFVCIAGAAALEVPTGVVLLVDPALFSSLVFGADMAPGGRAVGRMTGIALLALAVACWPRREQDEGILPALKALFLFSVFAAAYLVYLGIGGTLVGILLWPATATHFAFAIILALTWIRRRADLALRARTGDSS